MAMEEDFQRYREIGERNRVVHTLLRNWCAHAEVSREGSGGLMEQMTGLPLAMCRVTCKHERARGSISMHLEQNALNFYDRNCVDCAHRQPVGFPNLSQLVGQRDAQREAASLRAEERQRVAREELAARRSVREGVFPRPNATQASLVNLLDRLDTEPSDITGQDLVSAVRAVPEALTQEFLNAVAAVVEAGGAHRAAGGLLALEVATYPREQLAHLALTTVRDAERPRVAAEVATRQMQYATRDDIGDAAPSLIWMCRTTRPLFSDGIGYSDSLVAAHRFAPDLVEEGWRGALRSESKEWRRAACAAISAVVDQHHDVNLEAACEALVSSLRLPDDIYEEGPAYGAVASLLAKLLRDFPKVVSPILARHEEDEHEQVRVGIFLAYLRVFENEPRNGEDEFQSTPLAEWNATSVQAQVFGRILAIATRLPNDDRLQEAVEFIRRADHWIGRLSGAAAYVSLLLGAAAVACNRAETLANRSPLILDPRPQEIRRLDFGTDTISLRSLAADLAELVAWLATRHPDIETRRISGETYLATMRPLPPLADRFRAVLIRHLGKLYRRGVWRNAVLHEVYSALSHSSVAVRSAATTAYKDMCNQVPADSLPLLLHHAFLVHLKDPYVAVHKRAVQSLRYLTLPEELREDVFGRLAHLVAIYRDERQDQRDDFFLADALKQLLRFLPMEAIERGVLYVIETARELSSDALYSFMQDAIHRLRSVPGIADVLLDLPFRPGTWGDYQSEFVLKELGALPSEEVARVAERIAGAGKAAASQRLYAVIPLIRLLDGRGAPAAARNMLESVLARAGEDRATLPARLILSLYLSALEFEQVLAAGQLTRVEELAAEMERLERELAEDEELNRERRSHHAFE